MYRQSDLITGSLAGIAALIGACLALQGSPAQAQPQADIDALRGQIAQLQSRLDKLESKPTVSAAPAKAKKQNVIVSGLIQEQFNAYFNQRSGAAAANNDGFRMRRGEIKIADPNITDRLGGYVMFDVAKTNNATPAGSLLQEFVISYKADTSANAPRSIDLGQYKPGWGYEGDLVSGSALQMVEKAQMYSFLDLAGGGMGDRRDQGVRLRGTFDSGTLAYNVGVFNGLGERQNQSAGGDPKAVVGRLIFSPKNSGLQIGVDGVKANTRGTSVLNGVPLNRDGYGGFLVYRKDKLNFQSEYASLKSSQDGTPNFKDGLGYYAGIGYKVAPKIELTGRYDRFTQKQLAGNGTSTELSAGVNYYIKGNNAKIQTNLVKVDGEANALSLYDSLQLRTQFQASF